MPGGIQGGREDPSDSAVVSSSQWEEHDGHKTAHWRVARVGQRARGTGNRGRPPEGCPGMGWGKAWVIVSLHSQEGAEFTKVGSG